MSVKVPPNPKFDEDFRKTLDVTMRAALSIRCATHNQTARTECGVSARVCFHLPRHSGIVFNEGYIGLRHARSTGYTTLPCTLALN